MDLADIKDVSIFSEHLGSQFRIEVGPDQILDAKLVEACPLSASHELSDSINRIGFSLIFEADHSVPQNTYKVSHGKLGEFMLFLTPVGPASMESVFN